MLCGMKNALAIATVLSPLFSFHKGINKHYLELPLDGERAAHRLVSYGKIFLFGFPPCQNSFALNNSVDGDYIGKQSFG